MALLAAFGTLPLSELHPVSITRFPSFRTQTLENLSVASVKNGFLSNPAPGENLESGNLVMETGCIVLRHLTSRPDAPSAYKTVKTIIVMIIMIIMETGCTYPSRSPPPPPGAGLVHPVSVRRFPSFRAQPLENLSHYL